jgi:hypothetical protein
MCQASITIRAVNSEANANRDDSARSEQRRPLQNIAKVVKDRLIASNRINLDGRQRLPGQNNLANVARPTETTHRTVADNQIVGVGNRSAWLSRTLIGLRGAINPDRRHIRNRSVTVPYIEDMPAT